MKHTMTLIFALTILSSSWATEISTYMFAVTNQETKKVHVIESSVNEDQMLEVQVTTNPTYLGDIDPTIYPQITNYKKFLDPIVFLNLKNNMMALSNAKITEQVFPMVCTLMPSPEAANDHLYVRSGYDFQTDVFSGEMRFLQSPKGCWVSHKVRPTNEHDLVVAEKLKGQIMGLSLAIIEELN